MVRSWLHVLAKPEGKTFSKVVIATTCNLKWNSIPMKMGLSTETLTKVLELEGSSVQVQARVGMHIVKLVMNTQNHLGVNLVGHNRDLCMTANIISTNFDIVFQLNLFQLIRDLRLELERRIGS